VHVLSPLWNLSLSPPSHDSLFPLCCNASYGCTCFIPSIKALSFPLAITHSLSLTMRLSLLFVVAHPRGVHVLPSMKSPSLYVVVHPMGAFSLSPLPNLSLSPWPIHSLFLLSIATHP
jgi:hypothetical protein